MQLALEVLPGFKLQFIGGVAHIKDQGNPASNRAMMMKLLQVADIIIEPTPIEEHGWEEWFPRWMTEVTAMGRAVRADVRMPARPEPVRPVRPGDINYSLLHPVDLIPLVTSQEDVEARRVQEEVVEPEAEIEPARPISWDEVLTEETATEGEPTEPTVEERALAMGIVIKPVQAGHKEGCKCPACKKRARQIEGLLVTA